MLKEIHRNMEKKIRGKLMIYIRKNRQAKPFVTCATLKYTVP